MKDTKIDRRHAGRNPTAKNRIGAKQIERRNNLLRRLKMGLANEQRRTEQLWWTRDLIEDLIVEKESRFLRAS